MRLTRIVQLRVEGSQTSVLHFIPPFTELFSLVSILCTLSVNLHEQLSEWQVAFAKIVDKLWQHLELGSFNIDLQDINPFVAVHFHERS